MQTLARILMGLGALGLVVFSAMLVIYMKHVRPGLAWRREGEIKRATRKAMGADSFWCGFYGSFNDWLLLGIVKGFMQP